ncbi:H-NS family nucleoid-associated regulatory protein [Cupriavidus sp. CV2]|uniref:H-NS family nucleoid-associated regulatory protein n=1 Tax=Cupriavidus ulmosensis TaxID=3065913 RepID=UPI00296B4B58|nr:H-NS family nucleoid-associated regulatory protein [Cupriavidus sp. CV2]MDW3685517.1 H-NS family nucleoid-associated regulatory protein [Cupriavidus sp. CV2]
MSLEIERAAAVVWVRVQMARHGLTLADLQAAGCFAAVVPPPAAPEPTRTYRNAEGQKWDEQGEMPAWLQRAVNAGQSAEHFRVG